MRLNYSEDEDEDRPGQFELWQANCRRSLRGKAGQQELRELEAALLALPEKRLIHGALTDDDGGVCAIAAYAKRKGVDISKHDPEYESDEVGMEAGMPRLVAWKVVEMNDLVLDSHFELLQGPCEKNKQWQSNGYSSVMVPYTPEERYELMLAWVRKQLAKPLLSGQET